MTQPALITRHEAAVEAALRAAVESRTDPIYRMMEYQLGWVDDQGMPQSRVPERSRAALCLGVCEALGGDIAHAMPAAAAVELLHEFTRVHEDIQSGAPEQGNRPSGWWIWGPAQAINVGDALHMVARLTLLHAEGADPERVLDSAMVMDAAALDLFEGQQQDLSLQLQPAATRQAYLDMAARQTGALLGGAAQLGALAAGADRAAQDACREAGRSLGVALRLQYDITQLWSGSEAAPNPVVHKSFPVVLAIATAPVSVKREIGTLLMARTHGPADAARLAELLDEAGARQGAIDAALAARSGFNDALGRAGVAEGRRLDLAALAEHLTQRPQSGVLRRTMPKQTLQDVDVQGLRVLVRVDFNVPMEDGRISDDNRIRAALPTIHYLRERNARVVLCSHLGRPNGVVDESARLAPIAEGLEAVLGAPVAYATECIGPRRRRPSRRWSPARCCCWRTCDSTPARRRTTRSLPRS